jgi:N-acetyltransferase
MPNRWVAPVTLEGLIVRLEPLSTDHVDGLAEVGLDPAIWRWLPALPRTPRDLRTLVEAALASATDGAEVPFVTIERLSGRPIGSTRFMAIVAQHRRLEIGWTWIAPPWQRTGANREAKLLMLEHAFETLAANRVEFKTDALNRPSRAALDGLGATLEGILRDHMVMPDGRLRHSACYSILRAEWPEVKARLQASRGGPG